MDGGDGLHFFKFHVRYTSCNHNAIRLKQHTSMKIKMDNKDIYIQSFVDEIKLAASVMLSSLFVLLEVLCFIFKA